MVKNEVVIPVTCSLVHTGVEIVDDKISSSAVCRQHLSPVWTSHRTLRTSAHKFMSSLLDAHMMANLVSSSNKIVFDVSLCFVKFGSLVRY